MVSEIPAFRVEFDVEVLKQRHLYSHRASAVSGVLVPVLGAGAEVFSRDGNPSDTRGPTDVQVRVRALAVPDA